MSSLFSIQPHQGITHFKIISTAVLCWPKPDLRGVSIPRCCCSPTAPAGNPIPSCPQLPYWPRWAFRNPATECPGRSMEHPVLLQWALGKSCHLPRALLLLSSQLTPTAGRCWSNWEPFQGGRDCCSSCGQQSWALLESRSSEQCRYFNTLYLSTLPVSPASLHASPDLYRELISLLCSRLRFLVSPLKFCTRYCFVHLHN